MGEGFIKVAETRELPPGARKRVIVNGEPVLLVNVEGDIHAVSDDSPHEDVSLYKGYLKRHHVHCPSHGSSFDVRTGKGESDPAEQNLKVYKIRVADKSILLAD